MTTVAAGDERRGRWVVLGLLGLAGLIRAVFLAVPGLDSDEAVMGLMAIHVLRGEYPIFYWGEPYCGPVESYLAAVLFFLFGPSRTTLNLAPALFSMLFLAAAYRFAALAFGRTVGRLALAFLALGPPFLVWHSVLARGNYIENLFLGIAIFGVVQKALQSGNDRTRWRGLLVASFLAGAAWWVSFQSVHFILAASLIAAVVMGRGLLDVRIVWAVGFAVLGSLPFWVYNIEHNFASLSETARYMEELPWSLSLKLFFLRKLPSVLGMPMTEMVRSYSFGLNMAVMAVYAAAVLAAVVGFVRAMAARNGLSGVYGLGLLLAFTFIAGAIILTRYNSGGVTRYFLVFYAVLPMILAWGLTGLYRRRAVLAAGIGVFIVSVNLGGTAYSADALWDERRKAHEFRGATEKGLITALRERGVRAVFAAEYWEFFLLNFESREDPVFAIPELAHAGNKFPVYTRYAVSQEAVPYLWFGGVENFHASLVTVGAEFSEERIGPYTLFGGLRPRARGFEEIPPGLWKISVPAAVETARLMVDRDSRTHWDSLVSQQAGWSLRVDLGRVEIVNQIVLEPGPVSEDVPDRFEVRTSSDGRAWKVVVSSHAFVVPLWWEGEKVLVDDRKVVRAVFPPEAVRFIEVRLAAGKPFHWRISEVRMFRPSAPRPEAAAGRAERR